MGSHPINLALRFLLEIYALFALGYWGWTQHAGIWRFLWTIGLPLISAAIWGIFRVPGDPGKAPVPVPGLLRLLLEFSYFGAATWALYTAGRDKWGLVFGLIVLAHYLISYDRIIWLVKS